MRLQDELAALRAEFLCSTPPGRAVLYTPRSRAFPIEKALKTGDHGRDFKLNHRRGSWPNWHRR
jgi:hypothetical protein